MLSRYPVLESFDCNEEIQVVNLVERQEIAMDQLDNWAQLSRAKMTEKRGETFYKLLNGRARIYVSAKLGMEIIKRLHTKLGHIGLSQMTNTIRRHYYFRNMDELVKEFCSKCVVCIENKTRRKRLLGLMSHFGPAKAPFEIVSIDTVGGFGGNRSSKRYMHLMVDHFTRHAWIVTSKGQNAGDIVKLIEPIASRHKIGVVLADQYSAMNSKQLKNYLKSMNIALVFTCIDCPASNGLNERLNQTLVNRIRCKIAENDRRAWTSIADECVKEYNDTIHSSTGFEPAWLLYGKRQVLCPFSDPVIQNVEEDRRIAYERSIKNHNVNKRRIDSKRKQHDFNIGDLVFVDNGSKLNRGKLDKVRKGPYKILNKLSSSFYEVDVGKRKREAQYFHTSKLLPATKQIGGSITSGDGEV
jgi:transposase InsO family protein